MPNENLIISDTNSAVTAPIIKRRQPQGLAQTPEVETTPETTPEPSATDYSRYEAENTVMGNLNEQQREDKIYRALENGATPEGLKGMLYPEYHGVIDTASSNYQYDRDKETNRRFNLVKSAQTAKTIAQQEWQDLKDKHFEGVDVSADEVKEAREKYEAAKEYEQKEFNSYAKYSIPASDINAALDESNSLIRAAENLQGDDDDSYFTGGTTKYKRREIYSNLLPALSDRLGAEVKLNDEGNPYYIVDGRQVEIDDVVSLWDQFVAGVDAGKTELSLSVIGALAADRLAGRTRNLFYRAGIDAVGAVLGAVAGTPVDETLNAMKLNLIQAQETTAKDWLLSPDRQISSGTLEAIFSMVPLGAKGAKWVYDKGAWKLSTIGWLNKGWTRARELFKGATQFTDDRSFYHLSDATGTRKTDNIILNAVNGDETAKKSEEYIRYQAFVDNHNLDATDFNKYQKLAAYRFTTNPRWSGALNQIREQGISPDDRSLQVAIDALEPEAVRRSEGLSGFTDLNGQSMYSTLTQSSATGKPSSLDLELPTVNSNTRLGEDLNKILKEGRITDDDISGVLFDYAVRPDNLNAHLDLPESTFSEYRQFMNSLDPEVRIQTELGWLDAFRKQSSVGIQGTDSVVTDPWTMWNGIDVGGSRIPGLKDIDLVTPEANEYKRALGRYAKIYRNEVGLVSRPGSLPIAGSSAANIATTIEGKLKQYRIAVITQWSKELANVDKGDSLQRFGASVLRNPFDQDAVDGLANATRYNVGGPNPKGLQKDPTPEQKLEEENKLVIGKVPIATAAGTVAYVTYTLGQYRQDWQAAKNAKALGTYTYVKQGDTLESGSLRSTSGALGEGFYVDTENVDLNENYPNRQQVKQFSVQQGRLISADDVQRLYGDPKDPSVTNKVKSEGYQGITYDEGKAFIFPEVIPGNNPKDKPKRQQTQKVNTKLSEPGVQIINTEDKNTVEYNTVSQSGLIVKDPDTGKWSTEGLPGSYRGIRKLIEDIKKSEPSNLTVV